MDSTSHAEISPNPQNFSTQNLLFNPSNFYPAVINHISNPTGIIFLRKLHIFDKKFILYENLFISKIKKTCLHAKIFMVNSPNNE